MNPSDLRALSIRHPWAELILAGIKPVENRTWATSWRGATLIHAGLRWDTSGAAAAASHGIVPDTPLPTGYLGIATVTGIHRDNDCCRPWGQPGVYHWQLTSARRFNHPIAAPGRLGLFRPDKPRAHSGWRAGASAALNELVALVESYGSGDAA